MKGDVIHIYDKDGNEVARGMTDFTSPVSEILVRNIDVPTMQLLGCNTRGVLVELDNLATVDDRLIPWGQDPEATNQI